MFCKECPFPHTPHLLSRPMVVLTKLPKRGRGWPGWSPNLGRVRAVVKQGRLPNLTTLMRWLLGSALETIRFVVLTRGWNLPDILHSRWRCLQMTLRPLHRLSVPAFLPSPYGQTLRCTAFFPLAMLLRLGTRLTIGHPMLGTNLEEPVCLTRYMPSVNLTIVYRTLR